MSCPKCTGRTLLDQAGERWCLCGWRQPEPVPDELLAESLGVDDRRRVRSGQHNIPSRARQPQAREFEG